MLETSMSQNDTFKLCFIIFELGKSAIFTQSQNMWTHQLYVDAFSKHRCFKEHNKLEYYSIRENFINKYYYHFCWYGTSVY